MSQYSAKIKGMDEWRSNVGELKWISEDGSLSVNQSISVNQRLWIPMSDYQWMTVDEWSHETVNE